MDAGNDSDERPARTLGEKPGFARWVEEIMEALDARRRSDDGATPPPGERGRERGDRTDVNRGDGGAAPPTRKER
jgi:hypothetical protein